MKFEVEIEETISQCFKIEANSLEDALEKARELYQKDKLILDNCNLINTQLQARSRDGSQTNWRALK